MATTIRANFGSHPRAARVYAYDPSTGIALVRWEWADGSQSLGEANRSELEALDGDRQFVDVDLALRRAASFVLEPNTRHARA